jgi:hypothetical protein
MIMKKMMSGVSEIGKVREVRLGGRGKKMMCDGDGTNKD